MIENKLVLYLLPFQNISVSNKDIWLCNIVSVDIGVTAVVDKS